MLIQMSGAWNFKVSMDDQTSRIEFFVFGSIRVQVDMPSVTGPYAYERLPFGPSTP